MLNIAEHIVFYVAGLKVDLILCVPEDLLVFPQICKSLSCARLGLFYQKTLNDRGGGVTCMQQGCRLHMSAVPF